MSANTQHCKVHKFRLTVVECEEQSTIEPFDPFAPPPEPDWEEGEGE